MYRRCLNITARDLDNDLEIQQLTWTNEYYWNARWATEPGRNPGLRLTFAGARSGQEHAPRTSRLCSFAFAAF
ncbi:hypothetical protein J6590_003017 [Homalodisca vitripennis]|nr:hypothetical protein J6590_003017 [Homalodisca vitripennis]